MSDTGMGAAVPYESAMGEEAGDKRDGPAAPLPQHLWQRLWQLRDMPERTPEQHAELTGLHEWATKYAEAWEAAPEAALDHLVSFADQVGKVLSHLTAVVPAAAGLSMAVNRLDLTLDAIRSAMTPPAKPPELPPAPEGTEPAEPQEPKTWTATRVNRLPLPEHLTPEPEPAQLDPDSYKEPPPEPPVPPAPDAPPEPEPMSAGPEPDHSEEPLPPVYEPAADPNAAPPQPDHS